MGRRRRAEGEAVAGPERHRGPARRACRRTASRAPAGCRTRRPRPDRPGDRAGPGPPPPPGRRPPGPPRRGHRSGRPAAPPRRRGPPPPRPGGRQPLKRSDGPDGGHLDGRGAVGIADQAVGQSAWPRGRPGRPGARRARRTDRRPRSWTRLSRPGLDHLGEAGAPVDQERSVRPRGRRRAVGPGSRSPASGTVAAASADEAHRVPGPQQGVRGAVGVEQSEGGPPEQHPSPRGGLGVDRGEPSGHRHRPGRHRGPGRGPAGDRGQAGGQSDQVGKAGGEAHEGHPRSDPHRASTTASGAVPRPAATSPRSGPSKTTGITAWPRGRLRRSSGSGMPRGQIAEPPFDHLGRAPGPGPGGPPRCRSRPPPRRRPPAPVHAARSAVDRPPVRGPRRHRPPRPAAPRPRRR